MAGTGAGGCVVCTPNDTHADIAVQVAEAGAHLLIEKPLATGVAGPGAPWRRSRRPGGC
ncbi:Gfo/Idh/MocA family oxidoreductase [Actinomadura luteofluorescens]|uniref:Gfo/Idh/MocA family oxidoreductase n=1 Tax=Actinomadura luteofluorescens TaxID=46163 RepID=UPI003635F052